MGNYRPISTKHWERFLQYKGYKYIRTKGSHDIWTKNNSRSIPVWGDEKEIPAMHLKQSAKTIGCTIEDIYKWIEENC